VNRPLFSGQKERPFERDLPNAQNTSFVDAQAAYVANKKRKAEQQIDEIQSRPFNPRTDVSADAQHIASLIVKNLWTIFVILMSFVVLLTAFAKSR
jgi:hypothetical protein